MKQRIINLLFLALAVVAFMPANAQIKKIEYASFDADTLTNGGTLTFVYSNLAMKVVGSGTQSSQIRNHVLWRRRKP